MGFKPSKIEHGPKVHDTAKKHLVENGCIILVERDRSL